MSSKELARYRVLGGVLEGQLAEATIEVNSLLGSVGFADVAERPPHLLFARSLDVRVWPLRRI